MSTSNNYASKSESWFGINSAMLVAVSITVLLLVMHKATVYTMVAKWIESETFSHGFFIFPISLYLLWRRRERILSLKPYPSIIGLAALFILSIGWFLAQATNILVVQQFAVIAMIAAVVWALLGKQFVNEIKFPLFYLLFAVPMGEDLIPYLMDYTAVFTVEALRLSGIPVYREGMFFSIPAGDFEVAVACSGVRYLTASVALGTLYAYLNYHSLYRRAVFILLSILVPILANGIRAYGIVMIAHLSDMQHAVGVDHLIYGWLFFGVVMLLLFMVGSTFRDKANDRDESAYHTRGMSLGRKERAKLFASAVVSIGLIVAIPVIAANQQNINADSVLAENGYMLPSGQGAWAGPEKIAGEWLPSIYGAEYENAGRYQSGLSVVDTFVFHYAGQSQGVEMVSAKNRVYDDKQWSFNDEYSVQVELNNGEMLNVIATEIRSMTKKRLVWHWYSVSGKNTASRYIEKLYEIWAVLTGHSGHSYVAIISAEYDDRSEAEQILQEYLKDNYQLLLCCMSGDDCCAAKVSSSLESLVTTESIASFR